MPIKRKQLAGLGIPKPPSPPSQNTGKALSKVRQSKNRQASARLAANIALHGGKASNATIAPKVVSNTKGKASPKPPIQLKGLQKVLLAATHVVWAMGVAKYTTMPTSIVGYIVRQTASYAWVYAPKSPTSPPQYYCASLTNNGLAQWAIAKYLNNPSKPQASKASPTTKPKKPIVKPVQRARQKPPTVWGLGQSKPPTKPKKAPSKPSKAK